MIKRILASVLTVILLISLVSCAADDGAPDGMKKTSLDFEPFVLYVPEGWSDNTSSGISSAFLASNDRITVTALYLEQDTESELLSYVEQKLMEYPLHYRDFSLISRESAVLGGKDACRIEFCTEYSQQSDRIIQICAGHEQGFVVLTFTGSEDALDTWSDDLSKIVDCFVLRELPVEDFKTKTDKKTPDGMKIASADHLEYRLYVPEDWVCDPDAKKTVAYVRESGRPNISVTSYSPDSPMTAAEYTEQCLELYRESLTGFELVDSGDRRLSDIDGKYMTYTVSYGGITLKICQTSVVYLDLVYTVIYTAPAQSFDSHAEDVQTIFDTFTFR